MEEKTELELRMYFFTIYQLTGIQAGIQCGHAALEYAHKFGQSELFINFILNWKTWIILNGGTTNDQRDFEDTSAGTLNQIADQLYENNIDFSYFREPDLNDALTAVCFICDERVFNKKDYPDFIDWFISRIDNEVIETIRLRTEYLKDAKNFIETYNELYKEWVRLIGGVKNVFLRELIQDKKLA